MENPGEGIRGECGWGCHGFLSFVGLLAHGMGTILTQKGFF